MRYREFFRIAIEHQYFLPGEPVELAIMPDQTTQSLLKGRRFIIKNMINGIRVLVPVNEDGSVIPILQPDDLFTFNIFPTSNTFHAFTEVPNLAEGEILNFTNAGLSENDTHLTSSVANGSGTWQGFQMVAKADIQVSNLLLDGNSVPKTPGYNIVFSAKAVKWTYYFVSDPETTDLAIQDLNGQFVFNSLDVQNNTSDKILTSLVSNFPDANLFMFESDAPIAFRSQAIKRLQLLRNADVIINHLPNPDIKDINFKIIRVHK